MLSIELYKKRNSKLTCTLCSCTEILDGSTLKKNLTTYFIGRANVEVALTPMVKKLVFPIALSSATTCLYASIFMFWEVRKVLCSTNSSAK
jgi:hypothetical protein